MRAVLIGDSGLRYGDRAVIIRGHIFQGNGQFLFFDFQCAQVFFQGIIVRVGIAPDDLIAVLRLARFGDGTCGFNGGGFAIHEAFNICFIIGQRFAVIDLFG